MKPITLLAAALLAAASMTACSKAPKGLTAAELRAAKASADNLCALAEMPDDSPFGSEFAQTMANTADIYPVSHPNDPATAVVVEATRLARERGCVK